MLGVGCWMFCSLPMPSLAEKQQKLIARFQLIEDAHERLAAIVARGKKWPGLPEEQRTDANRVPGCASGVGLVARIKNARSHSKRDAVPPLVRALVPLLCELYDGAPAAEIATIEPDIFPALHLDRQLSLTRL